MTTTLRVIVDDILAPSPGGNARYAEDLTRFLIQTAPEGCEVSGVVSSSPNAEYNRLLDLLPGLAKLNKSAFARRELHKSWQRGIMRLVGGGMVHSPSLLAPLARHDRLNNAGDQTVVTIHNTLAWTHPDSLSSRDIAWQKTMAKRAFRFAEAVVVPSHTVAAELDEVMHFGERIRVIGAAANTHLMLPSDDTARAAALGLPERYLLAPGGLEPYKGLVPLIQSLAAGVDAGLPLLVVGPVTESYEKSLAKIVADAGLGELGVLNNKESSKGHAGSSPASGAPVTAPIPRVSLLGDLVDGDLAVALDRATVFVYPALADGFGMPLLEAFFFGTPVVHSDAPALVEMSAGSGVTVAREDAAGYPRRLAAAIASITGDAEVAKRLSYAGLDRAGAFSWRDAAQRVWQLHADL